MFAYVRYGIFRFRAAAALARIVGGLKDLKSGRPLSGKSKHRRAVFGGADLDYRKAQGCLLKVLFEIWSLEVASLYPSCGAFGEFGGCKKDRERFWRPR